MPETPETHRLFFALWPDGRTREALAELQESIPVRGGRPMRRENIHLTLVFIGEVDREMRDCLAERARGVVVPRQTFSIERVGYFRRPRVVWVGPERTPQTLVDLVASLNRALASCGYEPEHRPFRAHITLFRKVARAPRPLEFDPIPWQVSAFQLVESIPEQGGMRYAVLEEFPLLG